MEGGDRKCLRGKGERVSCQSLVVQIKFKKYLRVKN